MRGAVATDDATREAALQMLDEGETSIVVGERFGVPAATVRSWRKRAGKSGPPAGVDPEDWAATRERGARDAWVAATLALAQVTTALEAGDGQKASKLALSFAILVDKSGVLERSAAVARTAPVVEGEVEDARPAIAEPDDVDLAQVAQVMLDAGLIACPRCAGRDDDDDDPPDGGPLLLLPGRPHPDGEHEEVDEMVGPRTIVRALRARVSARREEPAEPVVTALAVERGEVLDEEEEQARRDAEQAAIHWSDEHWGRGR